ncbi:MAG: polyribonucleotide nucleotidyltransferase [Candidatus Gracilibacteria bacterium]|nr:polyribonucleotide nucleotidyltransferase [Candidatus Gracilibacteria bacterium]
MIGLSDKNAPEIKSLKKTYSIEGANLTFESGKLALLSNGSVTISDDKGNLLFVSCGIKEEGLNKEAGYFPLQVEYQEKYYATGKIGGNRFQKREGRPSEQAVISSRIIDRPIRPMFPKGIINDVQIIATALSSSNESDLAFHGITGASLALLMTNMSFEGPVSGVRVSITSEGKLVFDPTFEDVENSKLILVVAGTMDAITMVEAQAKEVSDDDIMIALEYAHKIIKSICEAQIDFIKEYKEKFGICEVVEVYNKPDETLYEKVKEYLTEKRLEILYGKGKHDFQVGLTSLDNEVKQYLIDNKIYQYDVSDDIEKIKEQMTFVGDLVYKRVKEVMRKNVLDNEKRLDGRKLNEVRKVIGEIGFLPRTHGSALFQRGMTQILSVTTLGGPDDIQIIDDMYEEDKKRYIHHYNFPPYAVGEVRPLRGTGRREVGHGRLAEKALEPVLPSEIDFPYMIRVVSETMTCNGSSSMASVCGSSMSLMHAGVPISNPVAGVAMGMIYDEVSKKYKILSDIQAQEDFLGDMDFKVTRTKKGITAMQLDVKIKGLSMQVFKEAFSQGKEAIDYILGEMLSVIPQSNKELSQYAPRILSTIVPVEKIREVIGKGGENIQKAEADFNVSIHIEDDGKTFVTGKDAQGAEKALAWIKNFVWEPTIGELHTGDIINIITGTGAIVEFRGKTGMIHISKLSDKRVATVEEVVKIGEKVQVEVLTVDKDKGRIGLKLIKKV